MKLRGIVTIVIASLMLLGCAGLSTKKSTHKVITDMESYTGPVSVMISIEWPNFFQAPYYFEQAFPFSEETAACVHRNAEDQQDVFVIGLVILGETIEPYALYRGEQYYIFPDFEGPPVPVSREEFDAYHNEIVELGKASATTSVERR